MFAELSPLPAAVRLPPQRSLVPLGRHARLIGLDPEFALAVDDLPEPLAWMLDELTGPVAPDALVERAVRRGADATQARTLLDRLVAAGAVIDAGQGQRVQRHRRTSAVVVVGAGPLGVGIASGLALAGVGAVHVEAARTWPPTSAPDTSTATGAGNGRRPPHRLYAGSRRPR